MSDIYSDFTFENLDWFDSCDVVLNTSSTNIVSSSSGSSSNLSTGQQPTQSPPMMPFQYQSMTNQREDHTDIDRERQNNKRKSMMMKNECFISDIESNVDMPSLPFSPPQLSLASFLSSNSSLSSFMSSSSSVSSSYLSSLSSSLSSILPESPQYSPLDLTDAVQSKFQSKPEERETDDNETTENQLRVEIKPEIFTGVSPVEVCGSEDLKPVCPRAKKARKDNNNLNIPTELENVNGYVNVISLIHLPQKVVAKKLSMASSTLHKRWKKATNKKWPYRRVCKLEYAMQTIQRNLPFVEADKYEYMISTLSKLTAEYKKEIENPVWICVNTNEETEFSPEVLTLPSGLNLGGVDLEIKSQM